ncbi:MAG: hypothetical protein V2J55_22385 [Candidatus Competibacteraceae bacterium]|jgi:hypothetical protein|nr:hypothetical protein [Candidatus Competibacteraceae bacterium]
MLDISNFKFVSEQQFQQEETAIVLFSLTNNFDVALSNISLQYDLGLNDIEVIGGDTAVPSLDPGATVEKRVVLKSDQAAETGQRNLKVNATFDFVGRGNGSGTFPFTLIPD